MGGSAISVYQALLHPPIESLGTRLVVLLVNIIMWVLHYQAIVGSKQGCNLKLCVGIGLGASSHVGWVGGGGGGG